MNIRIMNAARPRGKPRGRGSSHTRGGRGRGRGERGTAARPRGPPTCLRDLSGPHTQTQSQSRSLGAFHVPLRPHKLDTPASAHSSRHSTSTANQSTKPRSTKMTRCSPSLLNITGLKPFVRSVLLPPIIIYPNLSRHSNPRGLGAAQLSSSSSSVLPGDTSTNIIWYLKSSHGRTGLTSSQS